MANLVLILHLLTALAIIVLVLLQRGKGAEMGASFGAGASQTLFGSVGSGNFFSKLTGICAAIFFATSFGLAVLAKKSSGIDDDLLLPELRQVQEPAGAIDVPVISEDLEVPVVEDVPTVDELPEDPAMQDDLPEVPQN